MRTSHEAISDTDGQNTTIKKLRRLRSSRPFGVKAPAYTRTNGRRQTQRLMLVRAFWRSPGETLLHWKHNNGINIG